MATLALNRSSEDAILKFTNVHKQLKHPFVVYCDFESSLKKNTEVNLEEFKTGIVVDDDGDDEPKKKKWEKGKTKIAYQTHEAASFGYKIVSINPAYHHDIEIFSGENAAEHFLDSLQREAKLIYDKYITKPKKMKELTEAEQIEFDEATTCHICKKEFKNDENDEDKDYKKCKDHCHILGNFRGAAHNSCNLNYRISPKSWKLPCFFHNL